MTWADGHKQNAIGLSRALSLSLSWANRMPWPAPQGPMLKELCFVPCTAALVSLPQEPRAGHPSIHRYILAAEFAPLGLSAGLCQLRPQNRLRGTLKDEKKVPGPMQLNEMPGAS